MMGKTLGTLHVLYIKIESGSQVREAVIRPLRQRRKSRLREAAGGRGGLRFALRPTDPNACGLTQL